MTEHDEILHSGLCTGKNVNKDADNYNVMEDEGGDDDDISIVSSCMGSDDEPDVIDLEEHKTADSPHDLEQWKNLTELEKGKSTAGGLKKLGNVKRKKFNKLALSDSFVAGNDLLLKTIKKDREKAIQKMRRKFDSVQMSIDYFTNLMDQRRKVLIKAIQKSKDGCFFQVRET